MKKSETIALYRDAYLEGKDEIDRRSFEEKDEARQYSAIMSWRRRQEIAVSGKDSSSPAVVLEAIKKARKLLLSLNELAPKDAEKLEAAASELKNDVDNFDFILKGRRLRELKNKRSSLDKEIEQLESEGVKEC